MVAFSMTLAVGCIHSNLPKSNSCDVCRASKDLAEDGKDVFLGVCDRLEHALILAGCSSNLIPNCQVRHWLGSFFMTVHHLHTYFCTQLLTPTDCYRLFFWGTGLKPVRNQSSLPKPSASLSAAVSHAFAVSSQGTQKSLSTCNLGSATWF